MNLPFGNFRVEKTKKIRKNIINSLSSTALAPVWAYFGAKMYFEIMFFVGEICD